jgi:hypothetical protein
MLQIRGGKSECSTLPQTVDNKEDEMSTAFPKGEKHVEKPDNSKLGCK